MKKPDIIVKLAVRNVRLHFLRSVLAALGIVIGVVAIASMGMMGTNMTLSVTAELSEMANVLVVSPDSGGGGGGMPGMGSSSSSDDDDEYISESQLKDIQRAAGSNFMYYLYSETEDISIGSDDGRATIYGMAEEDMPEVLTVDEGSYPKTTSSVLIGPTLAEKYDLVPGNRIKIGDEDEGSQQTVRVVGILEEKGMSMDINSDNAIIATEKWFTGTFGGEGEYPQVNILLDDVNDADAVTEAIEDQLNRKEDEVQVQDSSRMLETVTDTVSTLTTFVMGIAGVSLLVAAVSIFNVMMMSVSERTRENGILRSIGTRRRELIKMFVYEAAILGVVGAIIGGILSMIIGYFVVLIMIGTTDYFFYPASLVYVPAAMAIGIIICVLSGVYPAWHSAQLDPVEALQAD